MEGRSMNMENKKILIVEDDQFLRNLASNELRKHGFEVSAAMDGQEGLQKVAREEPDLILLDIILPGEDGFGILRKLKAGKYKNIPVVILSNLGQQTDIDRGMELGAADYIVKAHFTLEEIIEKIKKILYQ